MTHDLGYPEDSRDLELRLVLTLNLHFYRSISESNSNRLNRSDSLSDSWSVRFLVRFLVELQPVKNLSRDGRADEIANEIVSTFDLILIRFGSSM